MEKRYGGANGEYVAQKGTPSDSHPAKHRHMVHLKFETLVTFANNFFFSRVNINNFNLNFLYKKMRIIPQSEQHIRNFGRAQTEMTKWERD